MKKKYGKYALVLVSLIAFATAIAHSSCIYLGPECYSAQMAPEIIVESAINGTLLAPIGALLVSALFILLGLYALSAGHMFITLPLTKLASYVISSLCIIRGLLGIQLALRRPELMDTFATTASYTWFICGVLFLFGYHACKRIDIKKAVKQDA